MRITGFFTRYGAYIIGFLYSLAALLAAVGLPERATLLIVIAAIAAVSNMYYTREGDPLGLRLLGTLAAIVVLAFAFLLVQQQTLLIIIASVVAVEVLHRTRNFAVDPDDESTGEV